MRVGLIALSAPGQNAIGNLIAEKVTFFLDRGAEVLVFLESLHRLHPELVPHAVQLAKVPTQGSAWDYLVLCDIVFFEYSQAFELLGLLPVLAHEKPRRVVTYYGVTPPEGWPGPQRDILADSRRQRGLIGFADAVTVLSRFTADELTQAVPYPQERIHSLTVPLDLARFTSVGIPTPTKQTVLLFVGRLAPNKRLSLAIEALARLKDDAPPVHLWVVGDDTDVYAFEANRCRELAQALGVADRIRWLGAVPDERLPSLYHGADVLVMPSVHEGLGIPVVEAQAAGLQVVAARATALPETIADAGITFRPDDVEDFVFQVRRVLAPARPPIPKTQRVALVSFRFGQGFIGGAETSLRTLGTTLLQAGYQVDVYTTCTERESDWKNDLPPGTSLLEGFTVHRFSIDNHDKTRHDAAFRAIVENQGRVSPEIEADFLANSIQSAGLMQALRAKIAAYDAVITGPYLHGLTQRIAEACPEKTLLLPCFHDEPTAYLNCWLETYSQAGGLLYHTPEEQDFAQTTLGLNHPGGRLIGTLLPTQIASEFPKPARRTLVYCGRYSEQKNVPLLLEFASRYQTQHPDRFAWVFVGEGGVRIPKETWIRDRGRVSEAAKHQILAEADLLVQLSSQESLSLVALEAWQHGVPVLVHADCRVLRGQLTRSGGGESVSDFESFARTLDDLWAQPGAWRDRGRRGQEYVRDNYENRGAFTQTLVEAIKDVSLPLAQKLRQRGLARVRSWERTTWRDQFARFVDIVLDSEPMPVQHDVEIEIVASRLAVSPRQSSLLLPLRLHNHGTIPIVPTGPGADRLVIELRDEATGQPIAPPKRLAPPEIVSPGRPGTALMSFDLPTLDSRQQTTTRQTLAVWLEDFQGTQAGPVVTMPLEVSDSALTGLARDGVAPFLEAAQASLAKAHGRQVLPRDYLDVCDGWFARGKRWLKHKFLHNFKLGYVDVIAQQQSEVNRELIAAVQQLGECCQALDQTVRQLRAELAEGKRNEVSVVDVSAGPLSTINSR